MERHGLAAAGSAVVTAADMVAGHVTLDISCLDRLYLNGYVAKLQTPGGVVYFFHDHRGKPIVSPALFEPIGEKFRRDIRDWAQANGIPLIRFRAGERKADVMAPYLDAAAAAGRSQVVAIGCAQEFQLVWTARKRDTDPGGCPQFSFTKEQRRVSVFYVYIWDEQDGRRVHQDLHLLPLSGQGMGQRARVGQAAGAGRRDRLHRAVQRVRLLRGPGRPAGHLRPVRPRHRAGVVRAVDGPDPAPARPTPTGTPGTGGSCRCGRWRPPAPWSSTTTCHARAFFEALLCENMDLGRPENVELLFRRGQRRGASSPPPPAAGSRPRSTGTATWSPSTCSTRTPG